ncbi:HK97 gp10 family phage protein, partial [Campylobacter fetus subsp. fetus]
GHPVSGALVGGGGRTGSRTAKAFAKQVNHPGTKAQPYLEDGLNNYISSSGLAMAKEDLAKDIRNKVLNDIKKALK